MEKKQDLGFSQLFEFGAMELKNKGTFSTELASSGLGQIMRYVVAQYEAEIRKLGLNARINKLDSQISLGKIEVNTSVTASKKFGFLSPSVDIDTRFNLENLFDNQRQPTGRLITTNLEVNPETLFWVIKPRDFVAPFLEGEKVNNTFKYIIDTESQIRGARVSEMKLVITPYNKLSIELKGNKQ